MQLKNKIDFLNGYVQIEIEGFFIERLFNICTQKGIRLWGTKRKSQSKVITNISIEDFKKIRKINKKTKCNIKIKKKKGIQFVVKKYKNRKVFIFLFFILVLSIFGLSNFIWNIEVEGNNSISKEEILAELHNQGLYQGSLKSKIDTNKIIEKFRLENEKIAWVGIKIEGTNAKITIVETTDKPDIIDKNEYCNIVSNKEGIITKINVTNGTALVKEGDTIENGTKLIGGWMEGKYTGVRYMHASGEIEAKIWYTAEQTEKYKQTEDVKTGKTENKYSIILNKKEINFYKTLSKFEKYDTIRQKNKIKLFNNFYLPIEFKKDVNYEYESKPKEFTKDELKEKILQQLENELKSNIEGKEVVNKDIILEGDDDQLKVRLVYEVIEKIGVEEKLVL